MNAIKNYKVKAEINRGVKITPNPLSMRINDLETPKLEIEAVYLTHDGKQRDFDLTDVKILFETITPGGATIILSNVSSERFTVVSPVKGRFDFAIPDTCKDALGNSGIAYFRFITVDGSIYSTGDFVYTVVKDIYTYPSRNQAAMKNFNADLKKLENEFDNVKVQASDAVKKAGEAREIAEKAQKSIDGHKVAIMPHRLTSPDGKVYKYGFALNNSGGVKFIYEEETENA